MYVITYWLLCLLYVTVYMTASYSLGTLLTRYLRSENGPAVTNTYKIAAGSALIILIGSYNVFYLHSETATYIIFFTPIIFYLVLYRPSPSRIVRRIKTGIRSKRSRREAILFYFLLLCVLILCVGSIEFPWFSDAYRAHFILTDDISRNYAIDHLELLYYYGFAVGAIVVTGISGFGNLIFSTQLLHLVYLLLILLSLIEYSAIYFKSKSYGYLAGILFLGILEVTMFARYPAYDFIVLYYSFVAVIVLFELANRQNDSWSLFHLSLIIAAACVTKLHGAIGITAAFLYVLRKTGLRKIATIVITVVLLLLPFMLYTKQHFSAVFFPFIGNSEYLECLRPGIEMERTFVSFLYFPFDLTFLLSGNTNSIGPIYLGFAPLLYFRRKQLPGNLKYLIIYSLIFLLIWFWFPITWFRLRYFLLPFLCLVLPIAFITIREIEHRKKSILTYAIIVITLIHILPTLRSSIGRSYHALPNIIATVAQARTATISRFREDLVDLDSVLVNEHRLLLDIGELYALQPDRDILLFGDDDSTDLSERTVVLQSEGFINSCLINLATNRQTDIYYDWRRSVRETKTLLYISRAGYEVYK